MSSVISDLTGDGVTANLIDIDVLLPDAGNTITVVGRVQQVGQALQAVSGTVTGPGVPGSGTNYLAIEVNYLTGAVTALTSTSGFPTADANNVVVFQQSIAAGGNADLAVDGSATSPDTW